MTSKEEYKLHIKKLLDRWIRNLEQDPDDYQTVLKEMLYEKEGKEVPIPASLGGK